MTLKVCNGNEFEASDRLSNEDEDHEQFRRAIRRMVLDEQRSAHLGQRARQVGGAPGQEAQAPGAPPRPVRRL